jgi:hypothetical protein
VGWNVFCLSIIYICCCRDGSVDMDRCQGLIGLFLFSASVNFIKYCVRQTLHFPPVFWDTQILEI